MFNLRKAPLREVFSISFICFIALPCLLIFFFALFFIRYDILDQSRESIKLYQGSIIDLLEKEEKDASVRLSHIMYTNNGQIPEIIAKTDTDDVYTRYRHESEAGSAFSYVLIPTSEVLSIFVQFDSGRSYVYKTALDYDIPLSQLESARKDANNIHTFAISSRTDKGSMYVGVNNNNLIWVSLIAPDAYMDRTGIIDYAAFFQISDIYPTLLSNDVSYLNGRTHHGFTAIVSLDNKSVLSKARMPDEHIDAYFEGDEVKGYEFITTDFELSSMRYSVLTSVEESDLLFGFDKVFILIFLVAFVVTLSFIFFLSILVKSIINPVTSVSKGLRSIEDGNLDEHIEADGCREVRDAIHSFNSMARRIRALIGEYESKIRIKEKSPQALFSSFTEGKLDGDAKKSAEVSLFADEASLLLIFMDKNAVFDEKLVLKQLDMDARIASRTLFRKLDDGCYLIYILGRNEVASLASFIITKIKGLCDVFANGCISNVFKGLEIASIHRDRLFAIKEILSVNKDGELFKEEELYAFLNKNEEEKEELRRLSSALSIADERVVNDIKDDLMERIVQLDMDSIRIMLITLASSLYAKLLSSNSSIENIFSYRVDFVSQIKALKDQREASLYLANFITTCEEGAVRELNVENLDIISKAKRYIQDNYQSSELSLGSVAEYVGLNEKYFSTLFTKETGENFISYLTATRMQSAASLLKKTTFKVYEVAEMAGYSNPEHFNRAFRKFYGVSPSEFRKIDKREEKT